MNHKIALIALVLAGVCLAGPVPAADPPSRGDRQGGQSGAARPPSLAPWVDSDTADTSGTLYKTFKSPAINEDVSYLLYLPPDYDTSTARYPSMYWFHGINGSPLGGVSIVEILDAAIREGKAPPMIIVLVNGIRRTFCTSFKDGSRPVEEVILDLVRHVDETYRTIPAREARAVEGFSMGGFGAWFLGLKYPETFGVISSLGGALLEEGSMTGRHSDIFQMVYGGDVEYFRANNPWLLVEKKADEIRGKTVMRLLVGEEDGLKDANQKFHELLDSLNIPHEFAISPKATHSQGEVYRGLGDDASAFYSRAFAQVLAAPAPETRAEDPQTTPTARGGRGGRGARGAGERGAGVSNNAPLAWVGVGTIEGWQTFTVKTEDGVETPALWVAPDGEGPFPAIVWLHGAPAAQGEAGERREADRGRFDLFLKAGFVVCLGDYRGNSPEGSELSGPDDAAAIVRHVKSLPMVDPDRIAIMGHSMGGATTLLAATREEVACVVDSAAAAYSVIGMAGGSLRGRPAGGELPEEEYDKERAIANLGKINAPTLILYGEADPLSRINKTIYDIMKELGKDVRLESFPGEHHGMLFRPNDPERGLQAWNTMLEFVSGALKPVEAQ